MEETQREEKDANEDLCASQCLALDSGWQLYAAQKQAFTPKILEAYEYAMLNAHAIFERGARGANVDWLIYQVTPAREPQPLTGGDGTARSCSSRGAHPADQAGA